MEAQKNDLKTGGKNGAVRWLAFTMGAVLLLLAAFAGAVVYVDPFFHYHKPVPGLAYPIDSERYQNDGISRHFEYDAVLTGTSMMENFKTSLFDRLFGARSIKIPFAGGYYKEVDQAVSRAVSYNPHIRMVCRGLDRSFLLQEADAVNPAAPAPDYLWDDNLWNDVEYILNKEVIFGNLRAVSARGAEALYRGRPAHGFGKSGAECVKDCKRESADHILLLYSSLQHRLVGQRADGKG